MLGAETETIAKPGFAIGSVRTHTGLTVDGFDVVFMRVKGDHLDLRAPALARRHQRRQPQSLFGPGPPPGRPAGPGGEGGECDWIDCAEVMKAKPWNSTLQEAATEKSAMPFDPSHEKQLLLDPVGGYEWSLRSDFGKTKDAGGLGSTACSNSGMAVACLLVGFDLPAERLLKQAAEWVQIAIASDERPQRYSPGASEASRFQTLALCNWLLDRHDGKPPAVCRNTKTAARTARQAMIQGRRFTCNLT